LSSTLNLLLTYGWRVQDIDRELAVVHAQMAHVLSLQQQDTEALERLTQVLALDLQSDVATHALCTSNSLVLKAQACDTLPKVRLSRCKRHLPGVVVGVSQHSIRKLTSWAVPAAQ
jgi:hypothetical protein